VTITPGPRRLADAADDYSKALDTLEARAVKNTRELLRRSLDTVLQNLRRSYALYLEALGPMSRDPSGQFIRRPGSYSTAEATAKFRAIMRDAAGFMSDMELQQWQFRYEQDLREATTLGVDLASELTKLQRVPPPAGPDIGPTTPGQVQTLGQELVAMVSRPDSAVPFAGVNPEVTRAAALQASAYIQGETVKFRDQIVQIVGEGASRGWGPKRLERDIRQALRGAKDPNGITKRLGLEQRAELIARSELAAAYSGGTIRKAQAEGLAYVRVLASNDERTCPTCASRNGRVYPADRVPVPWHPRCVLGDTHVSPGLLAAVFRSRYRGNVVSIGLQSGERLTVTANHPMLTTTGWVKAEALRPGDQLVGHGLHRVMPEVAVAPDLHQMPATAEEVFAAFSQSGAVTTVRMPVSALDLHGDGQFIEGDVDVVRADGLFECYREASGVDGASEGERITGSVRLRPFATLGDVDAGLLWHSATAHGSVSRLREAQALFRGGLSHAEQHRIATTAWRDPVLAQEVGDGLALHPELLGDRFDAAAFLECPECGSLIEHQAVAIGSDADLLEVSADDIHGNAIGGSDSVDAQTGLVENHEVVSVEVDSFHGFVYTFETFAGAYAIGCDARLITRNCRCVVTPVNNEAVTEKDPALRATLLDSQRWQEEHNRGVEAYAEARHQERVDVLRGQIDRAKDGDAKDTLSAQLQRLVEQGPDIVKARAELAQALRTPTASERRLFGKGAQTLRESVPLFD
jgi:SPP1 gp7 family putative phage head morphogenesis protein